MDVKGRIWYMAGLFISFEGGEGVGKSTQARLLAEYLQKQDYSVLLTQEPGGTKMGLILRRLLLEPAEDRPVPRAELLLYLADRAQHVQTVIVPALGNKDVVICDRFADATLAYQGYGRGLDTEFIECLNHFVTQGLEPQLTILLDLEARAALARLGSRSQGSLKDRMEQESIALHQRVREGYLKLAAKYPHRFKIIAADQEIKTIHTQIINHVHPLVNRR